jgi:hypothetical protein
LLLGDFTLSFTPCGAGVNSKCKYKKYKYNYMTHVALRGAFHRSLTVLVCYRFPCICVKHQYLAFDVSLPPPNYLSCSPKQLDSGSIGYSKNFNSKRVRNVAVTLYGGDKSTVAFQRVNARLCELKI